MVRKIYSSPVRFDRYHSRHVFTGTCRLLLAVGTLLSIGGRVEAGQEEPFIIAPSPVIHDTVPAPAQAVSSGTATLLFRAILRDENRNFLLHSGERLSVEIEVKNEGPAAASGVEVLVSGTPELIGQIPGVLSVGDIPSGEVKRVELNGKVGTVNQSFQAELTLALHVPSQAIPVHLPAAKKFLVAMRPVTAPDAMLMPVDVDVVPKGSGRLIQPTAVGVAIGIGRFREDALPRVKYATRDADMVASYWSAVGGIRPERIRRLTDAHALKRDVAETFEEWLPRLIDSTSVVYVYISGRGSVEPTTGAVSVIPFDGTATSDARHYSLKRLQRALVKLPIRQAIIVVDLSLEPLQTPGEIKEIAPLWEPVGEGTEKIMWMVGNRTVQEAHAYDPGQHGLFTYQLLLGLGGAADIDKDGTILAWELCTYAKGQVVTIAREQFGNAQEPLCIPGPGEGAMVWLQPMAKLK